MKLLILSVRLSIYGFYCDMCSKVCTIVAERCISKNKPLNKKLLTFVSNLSHNNYVRWQRLEKRVIKLLHQPF